MSTKRTSKKGTAATVENTARPWVKNDKGATITCTPSGHLELTEEGLFVTCNDCTPPVRQLVTRAEGSTRAKVRCACGLDALVVVEVA